jgi:hypothetical protein
MPSASLNVELSAAGVSINGNMTRTGDGGIGVEPTIAVAHVVGSWVKTDADTAAGSLTGGHGLATGTFDVYWTGGARFDVPVTITTNTLALDGGTGDDFPASANATVVLAPQTAFNVSIDGDALEVLGMKLVFSDTSLSTAGRVLLEDAANDDIASVELVANVPQIWDIDAGANNPFTGDPITHAKASHANTSATATLKICGIQDVTP